MTIVSARGIFNQPHHVLVKILKASKAPALFLPNILFFY